MYRFLIVLEQTETGYSAYSPDLSGCVATGSTREETETNIYEAIEMHIEGMLEDGIPVPESRATSEYVILKGPEEQVA